MKSSNLISLIFVGCIFLILFAFALDRTTLYADTQAGIEAGRAFSTLDEFTYDFHTWRPVGHIIINTLLAAAVGFNNMIWGTTVLSTVLALIGVLSIVRLTVFWGGSKSMALALVGTAPLIIYYANSGVTDIQHFTCIALALIVLVGATPLQHPGLRFFLFSLFISAAGSLRPTLFGLGFVFLLANDLGRLTFKRILIRQLTMGLFIIAVIGLQLIVLVMMRGREYGWMTFSNMFSGLIASHTSKEISASRYNLMDGIRQILASFGTALCLSWIFLLLDNIRTARRPVFFSLAWIIWCIIHIFAIPNYQARYYITGLVVAIPATLALIAHRRKSTRWSLLILLLILPLIELPHGLKYQRTLALRTPLNKLVVDDIALLHGNRHFYRGQYFSQLVAQGPTWSNDPYVSVFSIDRSSLNIFMEARFHLWKPKSLIDWKDMTSWTAGLVDTAMIEDGKDPVLDGDIFALSPAPRVYIQMDIPPAGTDLNVLATIRPEFFKTNEIPSQQMPLLIQRIRRHRITRGPNGDTAGPLKLNGSNPETWSGWPKAGRLQRMGTHWDLVWIDHVRLYHRDGLLYEWTYTEDL